MATTLSADVGSGPSLYVGGAFSVAGNQVATNIARWDGSSWHALGSGIGDLVNSCVYALAVHGGDLYAAGDILAGPTSGVGVARWNGQQWTPLPLRPGSKGTALASYGGALIVGGRLTKLNGESLGALARWDGSSWSTLGGGLVSNRIASLVVHGGDLYVGGSFYLAALQRWTNIARWDGTAWSIPTTPLNGEVRALTFFNDELVATGAFDSDGHTALRGIARWTDGGSWQPLGDGLEEFVYGNEGGYCLLVSGGELVVGGYIFLAPVDVPCSRDTWVWGVARWDGSCWRGLGVHDFGQVNTLAEFAGKLVACAWDERGPHIQGWDGQDWKDISSGSDGAVRKLAVHDGDLVALGDFREIGGSPAEGLAQYTEGQWRAFSPFFSGNSPHGLAVFDNELVLGAAYIGWPGGYAAGVAAWNGSQWHGLGTGLNGTGNGTDGAHAFTVYKGELLAGGAFVYAGATPVANVARWDGAAWHSLGNGVPNMVTHFAVWGEDLIAAATGSLSYGPTRMYRWDGTAWSPMGGSGYGPPAAVLVHNGDLIVAGPTLALWNQQYATALCRWNGSSWEPFGGRLFISVGALIEDNGGLIADAFYENEPDVFVRSLIRWDGTDWTVLGPSPGAMTLMRKGAEIVAGGSFRAIGDTVSAYLARFLSASAADVNFDGFLDGIDADLFNNSFETGRPNADINGDGFVDGIDYDTFNNAYEAGC